MCLWQEAINANGDNKMIIANSYGMELLELCCTKALWDRVYEWTEKQPEDYIGAATYGYEMIQAALNLDHNTVTRLERFFPEVVAEKGLPVVKAEKLKAARKDKRDSNDSSKAGSTPYSKRRGAENVHLVNGKA